MEKTWARQDWRFILGPPATHKPGDVVEVDLPDLHFPHLQNGDIITFPHRAVVRNRNYVNHREMSGLEQLLIKS